MHGSYGIVREAMSRKRRKGYYVDGTFVPEGSRLDEQLRAERAAADAPSRTARKAASRDLRDVGADLVDLPRDALDALPLPEALREAIDEAKRITSFGARRRQVQFIGKLMRRLDPQTLEALRHALGAAQSGARRFD